MSFAAIRYHNPYMASDTKAFRMFLLLLVLGAFVLVAAHQFRYDYFGTGRGGAAGRGLSFKDFFVDKASRGQAQQMEQMNSGAESSPRQASAPKEAAPAAAKAPPSKESAPEKSTDSPGRTDRKELNSLIDQVAP